MNGLQIKSKESETTTYMYKDCLNVCHLFSFSFLICAKHNSTNKPSSSAQERLSNVRMFLRESIESITHKNTPGEIFQLRPEKKRHVKLRTGKYWIDIRQSFLAQYRVHMSHNFVSLTLLLAYFQSTDLAHTHLCHLCSYLDQSSMINIFNSCYYRNSCSLWTAQTWAVHNEFLYVLASLRSILKSQPVMLLRFC